MNKAMLLLALLVSANSSFAEQETYNKNGYTVSSEKNSISFDNKLVLRDKVCINNYLYGTVYTWGSFYVPFPLFKDDKPEKCQN